MQHDVYNATETEKKIFEKLKEIAQIAKEENPNLEFLSLSYLSNSHIKFENDEFTQETEKEFYTFINSYLEEDSADYSYPINFSTLLTKV